MEQLDKSFSPIPREDERLQELEYALHNLQGNILRGHGRHNSVNLFLRFQAGKQDEVRARIRYFIEEGIVTSALQQRNQRDNKAKEPNSLFGSFFLSAQGYHYLDPKLLTGFSKKFQEGPGERFGDTTSTWEEGYAHGFHAMLLLAQADATRLRGAAQTMKDHFGSVTECPLHEEWGKTMKVNDRPVEHFGYVDNVSNPLFFQEDVDQQTNGNRHHAWSPGAGPGLVLLQDPHGGEHAYGSYLVFLKLEQNPQGFALKVLELAQQLQLDPATVQAFIMGRFQDGTPVALQNTAGRHGDLNDFNFFDSDRHGRKCPYQAHIRKVNPRDDIANSRQHQIVRRGITYGERVKEPKDNPSPEEMPTDGVGLLFMCYQKDIKQQFEFLYFRQANNANFLRNEPGIDPVIGQVQEGQPQQKWPVAWGALRSEHRPYSFDSFVSLKGAEYFFAPSISFLKSL